MQVDLNLLKNKIIRECTILGLQCHFDKNTSQGSEYLQLIKNIMENNYTMAYSRGKHTPIYDEIKTYTTKSSGHSIKELNELREKEYE